MTKPTTPLNHEMEKELEEKIRNLVPSLYEEGYCHYHPVGNLCEACCEKGGLLKVLSTGILTLEDVLEAIGNIKIKVNENVFSFWEDAFGAKISMKKKGRYVPELGAYLGRTFTVSFLRFSNMSIEVKDEETTSYIPVFLDILLFYIKTLKNKISQDWQYGKPLSEQSTETKMFLFDILCK